MADAAPARFAFTKLVVDDLDAAERFYAAVLGLRRTRRTPPGEPVFGKEEIVMAPAAAAGPLLILMRFATRPCPPPGCCFVGFAVADAAATADAAERHGGCVLVRVGPDQAEGRRAAVFKDPAGHVVEIVEAAPAGT